MGLDCIRLVVVDSRALLHRLFLIAARSDMALPAAPPLAHAFALLLLQRLSPSIFFSSPGRPFLCLHARPSRHEILLRSAFSCSMLFSAKDY
jgi:hypothetical protein